MDSNNPQQPPKFEHYCLVELFGHSQIAGFVTEATIAGGAFIRVDVPNPHGEGDLYTRYFGPSAIYAINPTTKEAVLEMVKELHPKPPTPRARDPRQLGPMRDPDGQDSWAYEDEMRDPDYRDEEEEKEAEAAGPGALDAMTEDDAGF